MRVTERPCHADSGVCALQGRKWLEAGAEHGTFSVRPTCVSQRQPNVGTLNGPAALGVSKLSPCDAVVENAYDYQPLYDG